MKEEIQRQYWSTKEVAVMLKVSRSCVRFWCETFGIGFMRSQANHRRFMERDITKFRVIQFLLEVEKYTIDGAKSKLNFIKWPMEAERWEQEVRNQLGRIVQTKN